MPNIIQMPNSSRIGSGGNSGGGGGINIGCCRVCTCINLEFLKTKSGILKICEMILGSLCETLLVQFGLPYANDIGQAFISFLTTVSSCLATVTILLICYVLSAKSFHLIRQSLFEVVFNAWACIFYFTASGYMGFAVKFYLSPRFYVQSAYMPYPAMMAVYYIGAMVGVIHGIDAYLAYRYFKGYR